MYKVKDKVFVDGTPGYIEAVHPNGSGVYKGAHHAYYWVNTPSLNFVDTITHEYVLFGRAVGFDEETKRLKGR